MYIILVFPDVSSRTYSLLAEHFRQRTDYKRPSSCTPVSKCATPVIVFIEIDGLGMPSISQKTKAIRVKLLLVRALFCF